jgi:hypothetical protein
MQVFDEITKQWKNIRNCRRVVLEYKSDLIVFGYTSRVDRVVKIGVKTSSLDDLIFETDPKLFKGELLFSKSRGIYFSPINCDKHFITTEQLIKGRGRFPYVLTRRYEAVENFNAFKDRQVIKDNNSSYQLANYLEYTFGLEFETSQGYIPEDICYRDGLIPLRDGSITAPEYSTVVLQGNQGISLLHQQIETLKEYTAFNKECSLHVHIGGYPLEPTAIFKLYKVCEALENELESILPRLTFHSSAYKDNGKDYCKKLDKYASFEDMYRKLVGRKFFGSFTQAHPDDKERKRKWNIATRYYFVNFINALCYNVNKTIEFRFLRPTYNFKKIILWLYIFNGILEYAKKYYTYGSYINLNIIMHKCYPESVAKKLDEGILRLSVLTVSQDTNGDHIGAEVWREDELFNDLDI